MPYGGHEPNGSKCPAAADWSSSNFRMRRCSPKSWCAIAILAMDMARVEAGLFMNEVDYTSATHAWIDAQRSTPFELSLDWTVNLDKPGYFVGRRALEREKKEGSQWKLVGLDIDWVGMEKLYQEVSLPPQVPASAVRASLPVIVGDEQVGYVSTSSWSPLLKKYIALAHIQRPYYEVGTDVATEITVQHHRKHTPATIVKLPFYEPEWKKK
jgi:aminomethyltransferase